MEGKQTRKSEYFQIPIEEYKKDMDTESAKKKKKQILDLIANSNNLRSKKEFEEIKQELHFACNKGDLELIKIYLSETIENHSKSLTFKIDRTTQTASLFKVNSKIDEFVVPLTIKHESREYLITSISADYKTIRSIKFVEDSAVRTMYGLVSPCESGIEEIYFPASLKELKEGWCCNTEHLTKIEIPPLNDQFIIKEDKYLLGKSDENNDEFDSLLFACRDIKEISIQANIKVISSYAFEQCNNLMKVEIPQDSNLQTIEEYAFSETYIKKIFIPSKVSKICESAFSRSRNLTKVEIPQDSNLQTIEKYAFQRTNISKIFIPSKITKISNNSFYYCNNLTKVEFPQDSNLQTIGEYAFSRSRIKGIFIPSKVSEICECAFSRCKNLTKVEFPQDSNLQTIGEYAFAFSMIKDIFIPSKVSEICENAFSDCANLQIVEISEESELESIPLSAFSKGANTIIVTQKFLQII